MTKRAKKSESIEVRVSHDLKRALMKKAADEGHSASEIVRDSIAGYLTGGAGAKLSNPWRHAAAFSVGALILLFAYSISTPAAAGHHREMEAAKARLLFGHSDIATRKKLATEFAAEFDKERFMTAGPPKPGTKHFAFTILDLNSDGELSLAEFREQMNVPPGDAGRKLFESEDANHDGRLSEQEFHI
jgi:hypothetical protein